jgi:hypothetical protein
MGLEPLDTTSVRQSPPEVALLLDDLFQAAHTLSRELDLLAELMNHPDHRFATATRWRTLISELCVLDGLLIDATRHAKRCCAMHQTC